MGLDIWFKDDIAHVLEAILQAKLECGGPPTYQQGVVDTVNALAMALDLPMAQRPAPPVSPGPFVAYLSGGHK